MNDYVSREELSNEEEMNNLALYTEAGDPNTFEETSRSSKWRKAMDREI